MLDVLQTLRYNVFAILQRINNVTVALRKCYISIKTIDILIENYKISIYHTRGIMRVISGIARGTKLSSIESLSTRPTLDRVKESLFNIIQNKIEDTIILDLFAGSGAIAIEFLSRGARQAYLCENNHAAIKMIYANLEKTRLKEKATVITRDYQKAIEICKKDNIQFDTIYLDPPYQTNFAIQATKKILSLDLLKEKGTIIIETDDEKRELLELEELDIKIEDIRKYGRASLIFLSSK